MNTVLPFPSLSHAILRACEMNGLNKRPFQVPNDFAKKMFPLFSYENAEKFNASLYKYWWWDSGVWNNGREDFLDWMIMQYKGDETNMFSIINC